MKVWMARMMIMGTAREASSHSFRVIRATARNTFRETLPLTSMARMGSSTWATSHTLRITRPTIMAPM